jgi:hypothetical protein
MTGIQQDYVGTTEEWEDENPLLPEGVRGIELTEDGRRYYKVGDGVSLWNDLPYFDKYMIKGLAEEIATIDLDRLPGDETPEMDGTGSAGDPENWSYSRSDHQHPSDTSRVALASDETQVIDSDVALANGKKLLGLRKDNTQANLVSVGEYGTHERIEAGTKSDPLCLNHSARATDGTVVGPHIIVEYKDEDGDPQTDAVAYESEIQALKQDMDTWIGRGGFLDEHDFGTAAPAQEALTEYALSQIPSISDPTDIWNGTKVKNIYGGHTWILTNTQNTDPPVFEWTDQGTIDLSAFTNTAGGYIKGDAIREGYVNAQADYTGKVNGWDDLPAKVFNLLKPVGSGYVQHLNDPTPEEMIWPGTWLPWSGRPDAYRLSDSAPPSFSEYTQGANYAAGACVLWHLAGDDYRLYTAKAAITNAPEYLDPVKWNPVVLGNIVERRFVQAWTDSDLSVGSEITAGDYAGKYVTEVIVPGGKFLSVEGGFRPPFVSGGRQDDRIRNMEGNIYYVSYPPEKGGVADGVFAVSVVPASGASSGGVESYTYNFKASRVVRTGDDFAGTNISTRFWRRVA